MQKLVSRPLSNPPKHSFSYFFSHSVSKTTYDPPFSPISKPPKPKPKPPNPTPNGNPTPTKSSLPFDFRHSYSETDPTLEPIGFREPKRFSPFGPGRLDREWTGTSAPVRDEVDSCLVEEERIRVLGDPLTEEEIEELVEKYRHSDCARQINLGKNGVTHNMLDDIHNHWKRAEAVRIKCLGVPTLDMDNACFHLEEKSGGKIIYRHINILILYRGRNYDPQNRPVIPLMLWKPYAPIYPKLVKNIADGLTFEETKEMRNRGLHSPALMKLTRNGVYVNVVARVREAFETEEVIRLDCTHVGTSDCKRIGVKLRDLVPCVPILFKDEQIILWRGKRDQERNSDISDANEKSSGQRMLDRLLVDSVAWKSHRSGENQCTGSFKQPNCRHLFALVHPSCCISDVRFSPLAKLKKLEILNFRGCYLARVPDVLRELNSIRLLYLSYGDGKWTIPPNLIQRLSKLEELYIASANGAIQGTGEEATTASLLELASLSRLTTLTMKANSVCLPKDFVFRKLQRYKITINGCFDLCSELGSMGVKCFRDMKCLIHTTKKQAPTIALFNLTELFMEEIISFEELCIGQNPKGFLCKLERFTAEGCATMVSTVPMVKSLEVTVVSRPTDLVSLQGLKSVSIGSYIKLPSVFSPVLAQVLLQLETLEIHVCPGLKHVIIDTTDSDSYTPWLPKLTTLKISSCDSLKYVFPISIAPDFPHLREIKISNCIELKRIFSLTKEMDSNDIFLQQLQLLVFKNLRNLSTFCLPNCAIMQLSLERLEVEECLLLATFVIQDMMRDGNDCQPGNGVSFHGRHRSMPMEYLTIGNCEQVFQLEGGFLLVSSLEKLHLKDMQQLQRHIFTPMFSPNFLQLKELNLRGCDELEQIIAKNQHVFRHEDETNTVIEEDMVLPKLKRLELLQLPSLVCFGPLGYHFMFPRFNVSTAMENCPNMTMCFTVDVNNLMHARTQDMKGKIMGTWQVISGHRDTLSSRPMLCV
ncbi:hypothetical protein CXB51_010025 [Gossypium anomalum]|uniref:CRM domain-containing protein n=1 Tax=Gossypium anomalum TaxID=47600 RepID=A0A8J5Z2D5_9ROSI|nr:hypothetical protein CXB51_010025 [Gossypium anomalum]